MRAAAEGVDARPRAGVGPLETPAAGQAESLRAALNENDHLLRLAGLLVADPQRRAAVLRLDRQQEAFGGHVLPRGFLREGLVELEGGRWVVGWCGSQAGGTPWMRSSSNSTASITACRPAGVMWSIKAMMPSRRSSTSMCS